MLEQDSGAHNKNHLKSNAVQHSGNMNQWELILITQSTVELPSALQKIRASVSSHLYDSTFVTSELRRRQ